MRSFQRLGILAAGLLTLASVAPAYYHWTYFVQRSGAFTPIRVRFDLNALPDQTVQFFIAKQGPAKLVDGDRMASLMSQIRRAGESWNAAGSALKVRFGGYQEKNFDAVLADQVTPGIEVVFDDDLQPGVLALSEPLINTDLKYLAEKNSPGFVPILRSRMRLANDLTTRGQASYSDVFFTTLVHEFGHTLGLQHSMTGGAMSTSILRGTSKSKPLTADDVAGLSVLYPTPEFKAYTGSVTGQVMVAGTGVNLASVVALAADGTAVGGMTLPDGTYRIEGLPPGDYRVYAHPLPPAQEGEADPAGIVPPKDLDWVPFLAAAPFETRFYPGTKEWTEAKLIHVEAARTTTSVNFDAQPTSSSGIYNLRVFAYLGAGRDKIVHAPPLPSGFRDWLAVQAAGILNNGQMAAGLKFSVIGDAAQLEQNTLRDFPGSDQFLLIVGDALKVDRATPVAVVMSTDSDLFVLPNALSAVPTTHPVLKSVDGYTDGQGRPHAVLDASDLQRGDKVLFDGAEALSAKVREDGLWDLEAPPALGGHVASLEILGANGQTSTQLFGDGAPPSYFYAAQSDTSQTLTPGELQAGTDGVITIDGVFTEFHDGLTNVSFGTSDVTVRNVWVTNMNQLRANVSVNSQAKLGAVSPVILTGLEAVTSGPQLQIRPRDDNQVTLSADIVNESTGLATAPAGTAVLLRASGLPTDLAGWNVRIGGDVSSLVRMADGRFRTVIPGSGVGANPMQLVGPNGAASNVVLFEVTAAAPSITDLSNISGVNLSSLRSMQAGDRMRLAVSGLTTVGDSIAKEDVLVRIGGLKVPTDVLTAVPETHSWVLEFVVPLATVPGDALPVTVGVGTRISGAWAVSVAPSAVKSELPVE